MRRVVLALAALGAAAAMAEEPATVETALAPLQSREVIERLKTMRAQLLLEQEYNRLLEARVKRLELEERLGVSADKATSRKDLPKPPPRVTTNPPAQLDNGVKDLVVKSVTVQPFKEAFVIYKGRVYTVRPGDTMGDLSIKDITENGVVTNRATVNME